MSSDQDAAAHIEGMKGHRYSFDWNQLAFGSKKPLSELKATFIAAPRKMSQVRLKQLIKTHLPTGNVAIGIAKEQYVDGLAPNPAFEMLGRDDVQDLIQKVNAASPKHKIYTLHYFQRDLDYILQKVTFRQVLLVRGSWHMVFHLKPAYYTLAERHIPYCYISPFSNEDEAKAYAAQLPQMNEAEIKGTYTDAQMLALADIAAQQSLDYTYQTGVALGRKKGKKYELLATSYNAVVPYQSYAMHFGNSREDNFSPPNDLNHYDTIHAEMAMIVRAAKERIDLTATTLFINLMPCPTCARTLSQTPISEIVYQQDHSAGYALQLLQAAGKTVRRLV